MELEEARKRLELFEIPSVDSEDVEEKNKDAEKVRGILAQLLISGAVSLGELQTARDIVSRKENVAAAAYVFLAGMFVSLHDGNTVFNLGNKVNEDGKLLSDACRRNAKEEDAAAINTFEGEVKSIWPDAVAAAESLKGDVIDSTLHVDGEKPIACWYFDRQREAVECVSKLIASKLGETGDRLDDDELNSVVRYKSPDGTEFKLGDEQKEAVRATVSHNLTVITGGPGTGKTTIVCSILRALLKKLDLKPADVALAAPTGRAAQRMGEALRAQCDMAKAASDNEADKVLCDAIGKLEGITVHSLLGGYGPKWTYNEDNPLSHRVVIVDESSMVDLLLMRSLLAALRRDCRLVLLGDKNQLPSVEAGAVLGDLIEIGKNSENKDAFVELTESRRFKGKLKKCAEEFNKGDSAAIKASRLPRADKESWTDALKKADTENGCFWYELSGDHLSSKVDGLLKEWSQAYGLNKDGELVNAARVIGKDDDAFNGACSEKAKNLFAILDTSRILAVVRKGPFGVDHVNELLLKERLGRNPVEPLVDNGIPVIVTKNTRSLNLFNGDVGVTVKRPGYGVYVLFPRGEKVVSCPVSKLPEHELAYAMTVHKSQGSEFENVMVVLPDDEKHPLLNRQIVYTGITRAKKRAVIVGTEKALTAALERKIERDTGISIAVEIEGGETK